VKTLELRKLLRDCRDCFRLAGLRSIAEIDSGSLIARLEHTLDTTRSPGLKNPVTRVISLRGHEAIIAALQLCDLIGDDNRAVVMLRGYDEDFEEWTGVYLSDYDLAELTEETDWFDDYEDPQLWVTTERDDTPAIRIC
jgi:hypothetical protein